MGTMSTTDPTNWKLSSLLQNQDKYSDWCIVQLKKRIFVILNMFKTAKNTSTNQAQKLILVESLLLSFRLLLSSSLIPDDDFSSGKSDETSTWQCSVEGVPEAKDGPVKDGNKEDESEDWDVGDCPSWAEKRTPGLIASRREGQDKVVEIKPVQF